MDVQSGVSDSCCSSGRSTQDLLSSEGIKGHCSHRTYIQSPTTTTFSSIATQTICRKSKSPNVCRSGTDNHKAQALPRHSFDSRFDRTSRRSASRRRRCIQTNISRKALLPPDSCPAKLPDRHIPRRRRGSAPEFLRDPGH